MKPSELAVSLRHVAAIVVKPVVVHRELHMTAACLLLMKLGSTVGQTNVCSDAPIMFEFVGVLHCVL